MVQESDRLEHDLRRQERGDLADIQDRVHLDQIEAHDAILGEDDLHQPARLLVAEPADLGRAGPGRDGGVHGIDVERDIDVGVVR
jgi:hypothetical protein